MSRTRRLFLPMIIVLLIVILGSFFILHNSESSQQTNTMRSLLKAYYTVDSCEVLDSLEKVQKIENMIRIMDSLYQEKYKDLLMRDCYDHLVANRVILLPEQIAKDFSHTLALSDTEFESLTETWDGYPAYSYKAYVRIKIKDQKPQEIVETGTIIIKKENDRWRVSSFYISKQELYVAAKRLSGL